MKSVIAPALLNWVPYKLSTADGLPQCHWLYTGDQGYTAPFFDETINECLHYPQNSSGFKVCSSPDVLPLWADQIPSVQPTAFIFHVSRCGSTLLAQLLGLCEQHIVLAETPFLDQLLRYRYTVNNVGADLATQFLPAAIQLYGRQRRGDESHLFIKCDSWHLCFYQQLRQLYPGVPFILLYRSPDEVLHSQRRRRGMQAVPGVIEPEVFGFDREQINHWSLDDYMAAVLERYFSIMLDIAHHDPLSLLVNYKEPILSIMQKLVAFTGFSITDDVLLQMQERSRYHAKYPEQVFREPAGEGDMPVSLQSVMELYNQIEAKRIDPGYRMPVAGC